MKTAMFFFSRQSRADDPMAEAEVNDAVSQIDKSGECDSDAPRPPSPSVYTSFSPPVFLPDDVVVMVNAFTGVISRGVFSVDELRVVLPVVDKLTSCVRSQPDWFNFTEREVFTEDVLANEGRDEDNDDEAGSMGSHVVDSDLWGDEGDDTEKRVFSRVYSRKHRRKYRGRIGRKCGPRSRYNHRR